jgi:hypothetical protein
MAERVWHRFLTGRDKARLAARTRRAKEFGDRPTLLCIDLYRSVFCERPQPLMEAIEEWTETCGHEAWRRFLTFSRSSVVLPSWASPSSTPLICRRRSRVSPASPRLTVRQHQRALGSCTRARLCMHHS